MRKDWEERGTWVNKECFYSAWERIWEWLQLDSIKDQMMKHRMVCDHDDLFWVGDSHTSPRERADNLLRKIVPRCGEFGYYLLYMCIRDSTGNPLGHGDAVRELTTYGMHTQLATIISLRDISLRNRNTMGLQYITDNFIISKGVKRTYMERHLVQCRYPSMVLFKKSSKSYEHT